MNHSGKKLLVLGATAYSINVIDIAHRLGAYVIVVDPIKDRVAKKHADKAYDVDTTNVDELYRIALEEKVDGIFTGYSDVNLPVARELCDRLGLPFYAKSREQILNTTDKLRFKAMCRKYGVGVVPQYEESELESVSYPIIIKPANSYASKGISVCHSFEETAEALEKARQFSKTREVIIEKYFRNVDNVNIDYVMQDGKIILSAVGDKFENRVQKGLSPLSAAGTYPSKHLKEYVDTVDAKVKRMFYEEGMHNGTAFIQSFYEDGKFYFFEMGYRVGGGQGSIMYSRMGGIDYVEVLINFALSGRMSDTDLSAFPGPDFKKRSCALVVLLKSGNIAKVEGLDEIRKIKEFVNVTQFYQEGETVPVSVVGNLGQSFCRIHFVGDTFDDIKAALNRVYEVLRITSDTGEDMILPGGFRGEGLE